MTSPLPPRWRVRPADIDDAEALAAFRCCSSTEAGYRQEVQDYIGEFLLPWAETVRDDLKDEIDARVLLVVDTYDGEIVAVGAHERGTVNGRPGAFYRHLHVVAVAVRHQGAVGPDGYRASDVIMSALTADIDEREASALRMSAIVHRENIASRRLLARHGLTAESEHEHPDYLNIASGD